MQSEKIVKTKKEIADKDLPIRYEVDDPASEAETTAFWKKLRNFYRSGEKVSKDKTAKLSSLLTVLDTSEPKYPYLPNGEKSPPIEEDSRTPFHLLNHVLSAHQKENRKKFKGRLAELLSGLNELLQIEDKSSEAKELKETYNFADEMIAFDKMVAIIPHHSGEELPKSRLDRLQSVVATLQEGLVYFSDQSATLVIEKSFTELFNKSQLFSHTQLIEGNKDVFSQTQKLFADQIPSFTELIKAYRIAKLEIEGAYQEDIHDEYFDHFTWHRLFDDELNLYHPIVLMVGHAYLFDHLSSFSRLLSTNQPVNVIVFNDERISVPDHQISWEDASHQFRQELATLAISYRNVYTFQAGMGNPAFLHTGLENCLRSTSPGVCHLFATEDKSKSKTSAYLMNKGANAGRYFPTILYDPNRGAWGARFDISENMQSEKDWPIFTFSAQTSEQAETTMEVAFTYADYKVSYPEKAKELMLIPSAYYTKNLVPLSEYLELDEEHLYGKIPYLWLVNEQNELHRAAVPNVWVVSCQERLDFWNFLQELSGINSFHAKEALVKKDEEAHKRLEEERTNLKAEHQQVVEKIKEEAMGKAAESLIAVLLDEDGLQLESLIGNDQALVIPDSEDVQEQVVDSATETLGETVVSDKPWVDSEECTTCNDCTDKYPNLFKYNEEKQAYIDDASKGTFAELVKAAENCPAACIHPGMPSNQKEPKLEALIKRAAKFNG